MSQNTAFSFINDPILYDVRTAEDRLTMELPLLASLCRRQHGIILTVPQTPQSSGSYPVTPLVRSLRCFCPLCLAAAGTTPFHRSTDTSPVRGTREDCHRRLLQGDLAHWSRTMVLFLSTMRARRSEALSFREGAHSVAMVEKGKRNAVLLTS